MSSGDYMAAAVCRDGHPISDDVTSHPPSERCDQCGADVLTACPNCGQSIRGYYRIPGASYAAAYMAPESCHNCGSPYPWAERLQA
jgi:hypothetical protein